jgi:hypothetical protein
MLVMDVLLDSVRQLLATDRRTCFMKIEVMQVGSEVRLMGKTQSFYQKQLAQTVILEFVWQHALNLDNQIEVNGSNGFDLAFTI